MTMSIHVIQNSFNAGEISPLMLARFDEGKYRFSCRKLVNFIPKIYGGAFRRPGTIYTGTARNVAQWTEIAVDHDASLLFGGESGAASGSAEVGALHLQDVRTVYRCTSASEGDATWSLVTQQTDLYGLQDGKPTVDYDTDAGYAQHSVVFIRVLDAVYKCTSATNDAAAWSLVTEKCNLTATEEPGEDDDSTQGYAVGSHWIRHVYTLSEYDGDSWETVSEASKVESNRLPLGHDDGAAGFVVGSRWILNNDLRAWELTDLTSTAPVRLIDFNVSSTTRYVIELGDGYARFWKDDATLLEDAVNDPGEPLVVATPYSASEIFAVQLAQLGNLAYFVHPNHPPQKLERFFRANFGTEVFAWSEVAWSFPCFRDSNVSEVTATPSATTGAVQTIAFSADPFTETVNYSRYTGARILLAQRRTDSQRKLELVTPSDSTTGILILGDYEVYTYGVFEGSLRIQAKDAAGAWTTLKSFDFNGEAEGRNIVYKATVEKETELRLDQTWVAGTDGVAYIEAGDSRRVGYARILSGIRYDNSLPVVDVAIEDDFDAATATTEWAIEAWADYAGYPRAVCFHEQRLWFGGTELQPNTIWASATNDFENFRRGAFDSDSLAFTLAASEGSAIQSMVSHDALVLFTQSEEWTAATSEQTAITPSNIFVRRQSRFGSAHRQAFVAANNLLFLQRGSRKLRQFSYGGGGEGSAADLTLLAEHVTLSGIQQIAFQQQPDPIIWCVRGDGVLLSLTYEADQNVIAWARHTTGTGLFESAAVIYGDAGEADEVWLVVNRDGTRLIERFDASAFSKLEEDDAARMIYLDSAVLLERDPASTAVTGLSHLEGEIVDILADGAVQPSKTVTSGAITLDAAAGTVVVGLPYVSTLQPSKIELDLPDGTAQGRKFLCKLAKLNLWKSGSIEYAADPSSFALHSFRAPGRSTNTPLDTPEPLFTGLVQVNNMGSHSDSVELTIRQTLPLPANILAMIPIIEVSKT
jgi:hypothetical protein